LQKRRLGQTDLSIAPLVLGGNVFGWTADEKTSFDLLDRFFDNGLNAIDTADAYSRWAAGNKGGESETIIGKWMKSRGNRDQVIVITKVGSDMGQGKKDLSAAYIEKAIDASLQRLQTDVVDLYLSHWPDPTTPYEETLGAYEKLLAKGKVRHIGASNLDAGQLRAALDVASLRSLPRYEVLQPAYNLYDRSSFDGPLRDICLAEDRAGVPMAERTVMIADDEDGWAWADDYLARKERKVTGFLITIHNLLWRLYDLQVVNPNLEEVFSGFGPLPVVGSGVEFSAHLISQCRAGQAV